MAQQLKGIPCEGFVAAIPVLEGGLGAPGGEHPEGIAAHKAPAAQLVTAFHRLQQQAIGATMAHLEPGAQGRIQIGGPTAPKGDEVGPSGGLP